MGERKKFPHDLEPSPPVDSGAPNSPKTPKATMLKFGDVSFDLGFERGRMSATGYVAKISMLRLNIGSGMLRLSSCMLSIGRGPKAVQGKGGGCPPLPCSHLGPRPMLSMHELSLSMPEPMLSLSMLILAKSGQSKSKSWLTKVPVRSKNHQISFEMGRESTVWPETKTK